MDRAGFFPAGRGKGQNLRGGAGQNLNISADLDDLLNEGEPWFEQNSLIWFACESIQERSLSVVTIPPLNLKIWRLTSSLTLEKSPLLVNSATILAVTTVVWSITCFHTPARNLLPASNATTPAKGLVIWRCIWNNFSQNCPFKMASPTVAKFVPFHDRCFGKIFSTLFTNLRF